MRTTRRTPLARHPQKKDNGARPFAPGCEESPVNPVVERREGDRRVGGRRSGDQRRAPSGMRSFTLRREEDASGGSGTGVVPEGAGFSPGGVLAPWVTA